MRPEPRAQSAGGDAADAANGWGPSARATPYLKIIAPPVSLHGMALQPCLRGRFWAAVAALSAVSLTMSLPLRLVIASSTFFSLFFFFFFFFFSLGRQRWESRPTHPEYT